MCVIVFKHLHIYVDVGIHKFICCGCGLRSSSKHRSQHQITMRYNCFVKPKYRHLRTHNGLYWFSEHGLHHMKVIDMYAIICYPVFSCRITEISEIIVLYNGCMKPTYRNRRNRKCVIMLWWTWLSPHARSLCCDEETLWMWSSIKMATHPKMSLCCFTNTKHVYCLDPWQEKILIVLIYIKGILTEQKSEHVFGGSQENGEVT